MKTLLCFCLLATFFFGIESAAPSKLLVFVTGQSQGVMFHYGEDFIELANTQTGLASLVTWLKELNPSMVINSVMNATGSTAVSKFHSSGTASFVEDLNGSYQANSALIKTRDAMVAAAKKYGSDHFFVVIHFCHSQDAQSANWNDTKYIGSLNYMMETIRNAALSVNPSLSARYWHGFQLHGTRGVNTHGDKIRKIMMAFAGRGSYAGVTAKSYAKLLNGGMMALSADRLGLTTSDKVHLSRSSNLRLARELAVHISREIGGSSPTVRFCEVDAVYRLNTKSLRVRVAHTAGKRLVVKNADFFVQTAANLGGTRISISNFTVSQSTSAQSFIDLAFSSNLPTGDLYVSYGVGNNIGMYNPEKESIFEDLTAEQNLVIHKDLRDLTRTGSKLVANSILPLYDMKVSSSPASSTSATTRASTSSVSPSSTTTARTATVGTTSASSEGSFCITANEFSPARPQCSNGQVVSIVKAFYGTPSNCPNIAAGSCNNASAEAVVRAACHAKTSCEIWAIGANFGEPCYNVRKHLSISYSCVNPSQNSNQCVEANEWKVAKLNCTSGKTISVSSAFYGTPTGCPSPALGSCGLSTLPTLKTQCNGRSSCDVLATNGNFGISDPCPNVLKKLSASYICQ